MAEAIVSATVQTIVSTTVQMLGDLLIHEGKFLYGVRDQVRELQAELESMQCFLKDADKRRDESESIHNWVRSIRNLAYKIENVLKTYAIKVQSRKGKGIKKILKRFACILDEGANIHMIVLEIKNIQTKLESINRRLETYGIKREEGESSNAANKNWLRQTFPHEIEEHFVGMQKDIDTLLPIVVDRNEDHRIISIYGIGGSGKTTLAKKIFNHQDVQNRFASFAWVTVSQQFVANSLLQDILRQLDRRRNRDDIKNMERWELLVEVCKVQKEKNCLVVLDDIWKTENWNILADALLDSKVLLTTRIQRIAEIGIAHKLDFLTEEEGWQLLQKKAALTRANDEDAYVQAKQEKLGKEMVRKCGYLPLAISVIGGMLRKKRTLEEWRMVNRIMNSYLMHGGGTEENLKVMQVLTLSFDDLPYQLKPCFLYFACYPGDAEIDVEELLRIWIAEGMVLSQDKIENETLMEIAQRYLSDMVNRSLIQVKLDETSMTSDQYKYCRLHDLIHDLCMRKCKEEDFLEVMDFRDGLSSVKGNSCRLTFYLGDHEIEDDQILQEANELTRFYSVKYFGLVKNFKISKKLGNLRFLNVVSFEGLRFGNPRLLDEVIKMLIHLRSLSFIKCTLDEVPSSVAMLPYLQTFYFHGYDVVKMPDALWKSKRLTYFVIRVAVADGKLRLDYWSGLETLILSNGVLEVKALSQLTNLRVFHAEVDDAETLFVILNCIKDNWLKISDIHLTIGSSCLIGTEDRSILLQLFMCPRLSILNLWTHLGELPKYESSMLVNLVELILFDSSIAEDPMSTLERLPKLKRLILSWESFMGEELFCSSIGFPHLTHLELLGLPNLKKWRIDEGAMPNLSYVSIGGCLKLEMIPDGMKFLKALRKFGTLCMPKEFNDRIRIIDAQQGIDFHKVRHVPQIIIEEEI